MARLNEEQRCLPAGVSEFLSSNSSTPPAQHSCAPVSTANQSPFSHRRSAFSPKAPLCLASPPQSSPTPVRALATPQSSSSGKPRKSPREKIPPPPYAPADAPPEFCSTPAVRAPLPSAQRIAPLEIHAPASSR